MKVTIITVYSNATVVDDVEELIFEVSEAEPEVYTELSIQRFNGGLSAEWFHPELGEGNLDYREKLYQKIRADLITGMPLGVWLGALFLFAVYGTIFATHVMAAGPLLPRVGARARRAQSPSNSQTVSDGRLQSFTPASCGHS